MITNAFTVDVEDYFQVSAFQPYIKRNEWNTRECRVEKNIERILLILEKCTTQATFFTLGWVAERYPQVVRQIVNSGHELASHGFGHQKVTELTSAEFYEDIYRAKALLEDTTGEEVKGYRAPSFSIGKANLWAFDTLVRAGYKYSSSIYPIRHDHYGMPDAPRFSHHRASGLLEIPITTFRFWDQNFPASGGGYFRLFPYNLSRWLFSRVNSIDREAVVFYLHPWEIDPSQPRVSGAGVKAKFRHYLNLNKMEPRVIKLLGEFKWSRMDKVFCDRMNSGVIATEVIA